LSDRDLQDAGGSLIFVRLMIMQEYAKSNKLYIGSGVDGNKVAQRSVRPDEIPG